MFLIVAESQTGAGEIEARKGQLKEQKWRRDGEPERDGTATCRQVAKGEKLKRKPLAK